MRRMVRILDELLRYGQPPSSHFSITLSSGLAQMRHLPFPRQRVVVLRGREATRGASLPRAFNISYSPSSHLDLHYLQITPKNGKIMFLIFVTIFSSHRRI
uniref:Uncharacterized protein n=1 Tax=Lygus hesperus TaxID=30085 RepID=A0A0K8T8Z4_LYGHE